MVITKRYNSVERFTSMQLSDDEGGGGGGGGPPMASSRPNQLVIPATQQTWKQSAAEPQHVTLMRRRSQEQLLQAPASPSSSRSQSIPVQQAVAAGPGMGPAGPSPSFFQQQQPGQRQQQQQQQQHPLSYYQPPPPQQQQQYARQQQFQPQQQQPLGQTRSIMRPASQPLGGAYPSPYGRELMVTPAQSRQSAGTIQQQQYVVSRDVMVPNEQEYVRSYFARKVPAPIWLTLSLLQIVAGIVTLFIGALNASPYNCMIEPNIPVYLILSGILLIVNGSVRTLFWLTSPSNNRKRMQQAGAAAGQRKSAGTPTRHLCEYALEGTVLLGIAIVIILGCIWVYGASRYMHSQRYMFEWHYCNPTVYWTAWWSVTLHLAFFALLILAAILLLIYGALIT